MLTVGFARSHSGRDRTHARALIARIQDAEYKAFELCTSNVRNYNAIQQNINGKFASVSIHKG